MSQETVKHTPGPWKVNGRYIEYSDETGEGWLAAVDTFSEEYRGEQEANARLIAAAPDLLEALKSLDNFIAKQYPWALSEPFKTLVESARAAISKAENP